MNQNKTQKGIVNIVMLLTAAVLIIGGAWYILSNQSTHIADPDSVPIDRNPGGGSGSGTDNSDNNATEPAPTTSKVRIALLTDQGTMQLAGKNRGCDKVVLIERSVTPTTSPLNAALAELFSYKGVWPYTDTQPGNFISTQTSLSFDLATIENGVAKIYLRGETGPLAGVCDDPRLESQIQETALQFSTVTSVEIYINGIRYTTPSQR
jgi:hypothetical protein